MENKELWVVFTKSTVLPGCTINFDGGEYYFAELFVPWAVGKGWQQLDEMMVCVNQRLKDSHFELCDISKCIRYESSEWQEATLLNSELREAAQKAMQSGCVEIGGFRSEEYEEECRYHHTMYGAEE